MLGAVLALICACTATEGDPLDFPDTGPGGKEDAFGRKLAGIASDYEPADLDVDVLDRDHRARREAAWVTAGKVLEPVPLLGLAESAEENEDLVLPDGEEIPRVPRFVTWYGLDDVKRIFQKLYEDLGAEGRSARAPFTQEAIDEVFVWNANALDRSRRWPLERYLEHVRELGLCPEEISDAECVQLVTDRFAGATSGTQRILYSPATVEHTVKNYARMLDCQEELATLGLDAEPVDEDENFTLCYESEMPVNAVLVKAQWSRVDFERDMPVYDTGADALAERLAGTAHWGEDGDRRADPGPDDIFTIRLKNGDTYRLVGLHIMTKELRHWQWVTLWWSDEPDEDFGADRPDAVTDALDPVWSNYKMCTVTGFEELDGDPAGRYGDTPSLADALRAIEAGGAGPSWCSNPYLEHGRGNARTNCIGCHQHGGSTHVHDLDGDGALDPLALENIIADETLYPDTSRRQIRDVFPADYTFSYNHVDDLAGVLANEVAYWAGVDPDPEPEPDPEPSPDGE